MNDFCFCFFEIDDVYSPTNANRNPNNALYKCNNSFLIYTDYPPLLPFLLLPNAYESLKKHLAFG